MQIVLASGSPRRKQILENLGFDFIIKECKEPEPEAKSAKEIDKVAEFKAKCVAREILQENISTQNKIDFLIIGADTAVCHDDDILGKPKSKEEAQKMLKNLSANTHNVVSGVCLILIESDLLEEHLQKHDSQKPNLDKFLEQCPKFQNTEQTEVTFRKLSDQEIKNYVDTHEPMDKAGAYGIQGIGGMLVEHVNGCYNNVVGLPVTQLLAGMKQLGYVF